MGGRAVYSFDGRADALYFAIRTARKVDWSLVNECATVVVDLDEKGLPIGVEILLDSEQAKAFKRLREAERTGGVD